MGKRHKSEEIVSKLRAGRCFDVSRRDCCRRDPPDWYDAADLLTLWTALPLQVDFELVR